MIWLVAGPATVTLVEQQAAGESLIVGQLLHLNEHIYPN